MKATKNYIIKNLRLNQFYSARLYTPQSKSDLYVNEVKFATLYGKKSAAKKALNELPDYGIFQIIKVYLKD